MTSSESRIQHVESFDEALAFIDEREGLIEDERAVPIRGGMASIDEKGYPVPAHEEYDEPTPEELSEMNPLERAGYEAVGNNPFPEYIPSVDELLEWGTEKGSDADQTRAATYNGERRGNVGLSHVWEALNGVSFNLDRWDVPEEEQADTRPVIMVYDMDMIEPLEGYRFGLPEDGEERPQTIDYAVVIDQDPTSEDYEINRL